jgi:hypothetical protein
MVHGRGRVAVDVAMAAVGAARRLDDDRATLYVDLVFLDPRGGPCNPRGAQGAFVGRMKVVVHAEALRELREALEWYTEHAAADRGVRLVRAVDARIAEIARAPESFPRDPKRWWARRAPGSSPSTTASTGGEALQGTREVLGGKIDGLDTRLSRVEMDVSMLKTDVSVLKTDVSTVKNDMGDVKDRLARVEHHLGLQGTAPVTRPTKREPRG